MNEKKPDNSPDIVGQEGGKRSRWSGVKFPLPKIVTLASVLVLIGVIVVFIYAFYATNKTSKDIAFEIEGKAYTKSQIVPMAKVLSGSNGKSLQEAGKQIFSYYEEQKAAYEVGVVVPQASIDAQNEVVSKVFTGKSAKELINITAYHNALQDYYPVVEQGVYKGYAFIFDFSARIVAQRVGHPISGYGDPQLIAKDAAYAKQQANKYHDNIATGKLTAEQLMNNIREDAGLGLADTTIMFTTLDSNEFNTTSGGTLAEQVGNKNIKDYVTQGKLGLSGVMQGDVATTNPGVTPIKYAPGLYYFVQLDEAKKGISDAENKVAKQIQIMKSKFYGV